MLMNERNIIININDGFVLPAIVMLTSFSRHHKGKCKDNVYILHKGLLEKNVNLLREKMEEKFNLTFVKVQNVVDNHLATSEHISIDAYFRVFAFEYLDDDVKRAVYIDADMIINKSIDDIYHMDFSGSYLIACEDKAISHIRKDVYDLLNLKYTQKYFNSGFMVLNIEKMKQHISLSEEIRKYIEVYGKRTIFQDQDILNGFYNGKAKVIEDNTYNFFVTNITSRYAGIEACNSAAVLHFIDRWKPWRPDYIGYLQEEFWKYAVDSGFHEEYSQFLKINGDYNTKWNRLRLIIKRTIKKHIPKFVLFGLSGGKK